MEKHKVKQGQCLESISLDKGFFWETLWNLPENAELKQNREDPNVLLPGDEVFIPDKREKIEMIDSEQRHTFRRKGVPSQFCLVVRHHGKPLADSPYRLDVDGVLYTGTSDPKGQIKLKIPPDAKEGRLFVGDSGDELEYIIRFGYVDPISTITGIQARLLNLSFDCGNIDGILGPRTRAALGDFQKQHDLPVSNEFDEQTRDKLREVYGR